MNCSIFGGNSLWNSHCGLRVGTVPPACPLWQMSHSRLNKIYVYFVSAVGAVMLVFSLRAFPLTHITLPFVMLGLATVLVGPRLSIPIPHVRAHISVSDTFIFLTLLLFGGEAAIVLATAEAICSSFRISKKVRIYAFNAGATACSTFITVWSLRLLFGETVSWHDAYSTNHLAAISAMAIIQYATNSVLVATSAALKSESSVWTTWRKNFLWTSITYFAGASAASLIARFIGAVGFFAFVSTIPIIAIIYFTYWTYMKNVSGRSEEHTSELQSHVNLVCRLLLEKKK